MYSHIHTPYVHVLTTPLHMVVRIERTMHLTHLVVTHVPPPLSVHCTHNGSSSSAQAAAEPEMFQACLVCLAPPPICTHTPSPSPGDLGLLAL